MEGAPKRQANAEEMLAELKRVLESAAPASDAAPPAASTAPKPSSQGHKSSQSPIDRERESDRSVKAKADRPIRRPADLQKWTRPSSRRGKMMAGGLVLGGAAAFFAGAALMNQVLNPPAHEFSAAATAGSVKPQNEQTLGPSSSPGAPMPATRPDAGAAATTGGSVSAQGKAQVGAPPLASSGLETAAPAFTPVPPSTPAVLAPSQVIRLDGTPIATAPPAPASAAPAAPPAETPKPAAQKGKPEGAPVATAPLTPDSTASAPPPAETPKSAAQKAKPEGAPVATAPPTPDSTASAPPLAETPKAAAAPQIGKPDARAIAKAPAPASTDSAPLAETPKPNATPNAHASNEAAQQSTRKADSRKKLLERASLQRRLRSPTPPAKPIARAERQSTRPAQPKEAERSPEPAQGASNPTALEPAKAPSVQQRVADGVTHAFGYLVHLPGALVPRLGGSDADAH